jgi:hypothetical protein
MRAEEGSVISWCRILEVLADRTSDERFDSRSDYLTRFHSLMGMMAPWGV